MITNRMRQLPTYQLILHLLINIEQQSGAVDVFDMAANLHQEHAFISKVDFTKHKISDTCYCYNISTKATYNAVPGYDYQTECRCSGQHFKQVPINLDENMHSILITDSDLQCLKRDSFQPYRYTLDEVNLGSLPQLRLIEAGTFRNMLKLKTLYISQAPQIKFLSGLFEGFVSQKFLSLRIIQTSLVEIPDMSPLKNSSYILHMIDLEGNKIERISANTFKVRAEQVILNYNMISVIENFAFNGSQISKINLKGNWGLREIHENAFNGLESLLDLDLSDTSIQQLPVAGLGEVEVLKIQNTPAMKRIPSVYDFPNLKEAFLTHSFHCCAFQYPKQHDPWKHTQHEEIIRKFCREFEAATESRQGRRKRDGEEFWNNHVFEHGTPGAPNDLSPNIAHLQGHPRKTDHSHLNPLLGKHIGHQQASAIQEVSALGFFHNDSIGSTPRNVTAFCGNLSIATPLVKCHPEPNALNPCEDIMGSSYLRMSVWFVLVLAMVGNLAVIVVVLFSGGELSVPRFLMCNLAFADLCMGVYLLMIASMDLHSSGAFFNYAFDWQYGVGCQIAGFLTVFASQLSIFTLTMVTVERWFAIAYAIYLTRRIRLGLASKSMVLGWLYAIVMAMMPLLGVSNYSSTSICLPMEVNRSADKVYLYAIIVINSLAFAAIVFCYAQIYFSLGYETRHTATSGEMTIAKKMALLVFTDFACWAPIAFFSLTALAGYPLISVTRSKILLVFFYPLNSCANPYLYAIMTTQYRKDFFQLSARLGMFKKQANKYSLTNTPVPLLARTNGRKTSVQQATALEDVFV